MNSPLADAIQAAFRDCRDMDASLGERLDAFAASLRMISAPFADAVDRLVRRLEKAEVGAGAPDVGDLLPPFYLPDEKGRIVSLDALLRHGTVAVVVHRGHWCPYCRINTRALAQARPLVEATGGQIVAIIPDRQQYAAAILSEAEADFPVLTDMDNGYAMSLNLVFWVGAEVRDFMSRAGLDLAEYQGNDSWMVPVPATFVVGQDGRVKARSVDPDYRKRMTIERMLAALRS
jgi:peroxiredoxin